MAEYILTKKSNLVAVADSVRERTGQTDKITLGEMINDINYVIGGIELPELTNEGTASDLLAGKQLIDQEGNIVEGTIATKTSSDLTASGATVTVPSGYYASQATKNVTTATQATPSITVDANGLITATTTQTAGYVAAGTKSGTKQLAFQPAKTITPSTASQIAVSSGYYTGGNITVAGDSNLVAGNIKSGVSIFGVSGTLVEGGGSGEAVEWSENEDAIINKTLSSYSNDRITIIGNNAFQFCNSLTLVSFPAATIIGNGAFWTCNSLTLVSFPAVTTIGNNAFNHCNGLTSVSFPAATIIGNNAFWTCNSLTSISFPAVTVINNGAFWSCNSLTSVSFPVVTAIYSNAFCKCYNLKSFYLTGSSLCQLSNSNAFSSTPIGGYSTSAGAYGSIYVPASLLTSYQTATNWTYFSSRFVGI